jgi:uncharacterized RDD family membrane protein YckC
MNEEKTPKWISGFWRRVGAFLIDTIVLGLVGQGLGLFLEGFFVEIGAWGRLIGFVIALVYFGVMNSAVANGQTLGKKALKLRVVNTDNRPISLLRSFGRYCVIGIPFFLNGAQFPNEAMSSFWPYILTPVVLGGVASIIYLYVFNRVTRQSLHDLLFGTYVVNAGIEMKNVGYLWRPHLIVVGLFFVAAAIAPVFTSDLIHQESFADLMASREALMKNPTVSNAAIYYGKNTVTTAKTGTKETTYLSSDVFLKSNLTSNKQLARELAEILANNYRQALAKDIIQINLIYGYDIGIASKWNKYPHRFSPNEFRGNTQTPIMSGRSPTNP